jgi:hypothetical protein
MQLGTATEYMTSKDQGVVDKNNKHYGGPTGMGKYNLDSVYYKAKPRETQLERLTKESNNMLFNYQKDRHNTPNHLHDHLYFKPVKKK